jgi:hypothetical protein
MTPQGGSVNLTVDVWWINSSAGDPNRKVYGKFARQDIPRNILIGKDGAILFQSVGFEESESRKMVQGIEKALRGAGSSSRKGC